MFDPQHLGCWTFTTPTFYHRHAPSISGHLDEATPAARGLLHSPSLMDPTFAHSLAPQSAPVPRRRPLVARPKALLCDLDGTLIDTMPVLADLATDVLAEVFEMPRALGREMYLATCGLPFIQQLDAICPGDARNQHASDLFEGRKPARCRSARMPADTRRALAALRAQGVRIVVSSNNGTENVDAFAQDSDFPFDLVLGFGPGLAKGGPHIETAERTFGFTRSEMLFIGDSLHDGEIAANEKIPFVGVAGTFSKERFALRFPGLPVVHRVSELLDLVG
jgi:phosphoglycolate phosphatase-like HAD superfamily hydrolase